MPADRRSWAGPGSAQGGATLVEMVIAIVIVGIALGGTVLALTLGVGRSADPVLHTQATAVAQSLLEEILLRDYADPQGGETGGPEAGETRPGYDDVSDYHALAANGCLATSPECPTPGDCVCDPAGAPLPGLRGYRVTVQVQATALNGVAAQRVAVAVTYPGAGGAPLTVAAYRTAH